MENKKRTIPSVNFHLWEPCNFRCKFCFATFQDVKKSILPKGHLPMDQAMEVVRRLAGSGFEKITFAGGEPTLCPWIGDLIAHANDTGMTTNLVTNGWMLLKKPDLLNSLSKNLQWLTLSIDSLNIVTNISSGRAFGNKQAISELEYTQLIYRARELGLKLKINTVAHQFNFQEPLWEFISKVRPERWKVFQVFPVEGQNDLYFFDFSISDEKFQSFLNLNKSAARFCTIVPENNKLMRASYLMIDPAGRFFDNAFGKHTYSSSILEVGVLNAMNEITIDSARFFERGGIYKWE